MGLFPYGDGTGFVWYSPSLRSGSVPYTQPFRAPLGASLLATAPIKNGPEVHFLLAQLTGLEPATSPVTGECSNQLSYNCIKNSFVWPLYTIL